MVLANSPPISSLLLKQVKCFTILYSLPKQLNLILRSSRLTVQFSGNYAVKLMSFFTYNHNNRIISQIWSTVAGYDELSVGF